MGRKRTGAHAGKRKPGAYPWRQALCVVLSIALALCPLGVAYGQGAVDGEQAPIAITTGEEAAGSGEAPESPEDASLPGETPDAIDGEVPVGEGEAPESDAAPDEATSETPDAAPADEAAPNADAAPAETEAATGEPQASQPESDALAAQDLTPAADAAPTQDAPALLAPPRQANSTGAQNTSAASYQPSLAPVVGAIPLLAIVVGFAGEGGEGGEGAIPYNDTYDWAKTLFGSANSLADYYEQMSLGKLAFTPAAETSAYGADGNTNKADAANDGIVHVVLPEAHGNWAGDYSSDATVTKAMLDTFARAIQAASAAVDYAAFDTDGDGALAATELALEFIVAGFETSLMGGKQAAPYQSVWAHEFSYSEAGVAKPTADGVTLDMYVAVGEKILDSDWNGNTTIGQTPMSIIAHETGHLLGLPDLYDTTGADGNWDEYSVDETSLMGAGNLATVAGKYSPTALDAWSRYQLGWTNPTIVTKSGVYTVSAQNSKNGYTTLLIPTKRKGEFYIIENRAFSGYDRALASGYDGYKNGGIVIWHIDNGVVSRYLSANQVNGATHRPGVMALFAEESDDGYVLDFKTSSPDPALVFWSKTMWNKYFKGKQALDLPLYGKGKNANKLGKRVLSGIRIQFLTKAGADMKIRIIMPGDKLPTATGITRTPVAETCAWEAPCTEAIPATGDEYPVAPAVVAIVALAVFLYARRQVAATPAPKHAR